MFSFSGESENLQQSVGVSGGVTVDSPYFRGRPQTYRIKLGDTVTMSCIVDNLGKHTSLRLRPFEITLFLEGKQSDVLVRCILA